MSRSLFIIPYYSSPPILLSGSLSERCQQEIDQVLEKKDHASYEDRHNMPYMQVHGSEIQVCIAYLGEYHTAQQHKLQY